LWRLRSYLRPYVGALIIMGSTAVVGVFVSLAIPLVTKSIIDGPITDGDLSGIWPLGLLGLALGITEAALILFRRWVQAAAVLGFETAVRNDLYRHMQALPMEFHGRWQSGQLLSRVTTDLSAIRRFTGFGMLFLVINIMQLTIVTALLLHLYWPLGSSSPSQPCRRSGSASASSSSTSSCPGRSRTSRATSRPRSRKPPSGSG